MVPAAVYPTKKNETLDKEQWNSFWQVWNVLPVGEGVVVAALPG